MTKLTPAQSANAYLIRNYGCFLVTMPEANKRQLLKAYIAGVRRGERSKHNGKRR